MDLNPTTEPKRITAGDLIQWTRSFSDFPASAWALSYVLINASDKITITAESDGDDFQISVSPTISEQYRPGRYSWQAYVSKTGARHAVGSGEIEIRPNLAGESRFDGRSQVKRTLDAINALIAGTATRDDQEYTIEGRSLRRRSIPELLTLKAAYERYYRQEQQAENLNKGLGGRKTLKVRF